MIKTMVVKSFITVPKTVICNMCETKISVIKPDHPQYCHIEESWGWNSNKDGKTHSFDLCEICYDRVIKMMVIPVTINW